MLKIFNKYPWLPLAPLVLLASLFRFSGLANLPPGLNFDEAGNGIAALDVISGNFKIWWSIGGGKEPLIAYVLPVFFGLFGYTVLAIRLYAAIAGVLLAGATYFGAYYILKDDGVKSNTSQSKAKAIFIASAAALGIATAFWLVALSRLGFRAMAFPVLAALTLGCLCLALQRGRWADFLITGILLGAGVYTYLPARLMPLVFCLFFSLEFMMTWRTGQVPLLLRYKNKLMGLVGMAMLVFAPLGIYFLLHPAEFSARSGVVSIFNPQVHDGNFWRLLTLTLTQTLGTFLSLTGDANDIANIPHLAMLSPLLAALFIFGLLYTLQRWRQPTSLLLLSWWGVMLLPALLAPEGAPHHLRLIGTAPPTYIFIALGLWWATQISGQIGQTSTTQVGEPEDKGQVFIWRLGLALDFGSLCIRLYCLSDLSAIFYYLG